MMPAVTSPIIFTIGHSNHPMERFLELLRQAGIERLVDVRSQPYSRWVPQFRRRTLAEALPEAGVDYVFLGEALGGRPSGDEFYAADGKPDYAARIRAPDFQAGVEELLRLAAERPTVIMCAEENPARCHRRALIAPVLLARGTGVVHVRGDARLQEEGEGRSPDGQLGLFSQPPRPGARPTRPLRTRRRP